MRIWNHSWLDVDPRHGGDEFIAALEMKNGPLPQTWRFLTGGGGEHILFRHPGGIGAEQCGQTWRWNRCPGRITDTSWPRLRGTYPDEPYAISVDHHPDDIPLAEPPPWLIELVKSDAPVRVSAQEWRSRIGSAIPEGQRNDTLARISGHLLAHGIDPHVCLDIILSLNATHCTPSLPEQEILNIVASIARREFAQRATRRKELNRG